MEFPEKLYAISDECKNVEVSEVIEQCVNPADGKKLVAVYELMEVREVKAVLEQNPADVRDFKVEKKND